jgi:hypothetical protein
MSKWIFKYLDGAMNETEMGPYNTKEESEIAREKMVSVGAMTQPSKEVANDYEVYKPDYDRC